MATTTKSRTRQTTAKAKRDGKANGRGSQQGRAALEQRMQTLERTNRDKGHTAAEAKEARQLAGKLGVDVPKWARTAGDSSSSKSGSKPKAADRDVEAGTIGFEAGAAKGKPISQRIRPVEIASIRKALAKIDKDPTKIPAALGFKSETAMRKFVTGENGSIKELTSDEGAAAKAFHGKVKTHQLWLRKAIAGAWGVYQQAKQSA
jgi:hypothetical protein